MNADNNGTDAPSPELTFVDAQDGARLAVHVLAPPGGGSRPVVLLHGLFSNATLNWVRFGHAQRLVDAGFTAIMPDLRAHGQSDAPHEAGAYPPDVLGSDLGRVIDHFELDEFDLVGFSLGSRTALRAVICGLKPRRLVLSGMGLEGLTSWQNRADFFLDAIARADSVRMGDPAFFAVSFMKTMKVDRIAARQLLKSFAAIDVDRLDKVSMPTLVLCGSEDRDNGSPQALADALPDGQLATIPGTHMSSVTEEAMGIEIARFLAG